MNPEIITIEELERDAQRLRAEAAKIEAETRLLLAQRRHRETLAERPWHHVVVPLLLATVVSVSVAALVLALAR